MQPFRVPRSTMAMVMAVAWLPVCQPLVQGSWAQTADGGSTTNNQSTPLAGDLLDGLHFKAGIVKTVDGEGNALEDTLTFSGGKFSSAVCERYNFTAAPYWIRTDGQSVHFLAELDSPTDGKMVWTGTIVDNRLKGTMRWTKKRWYWTIDVEHLIEGVLIPDARSASASSN